MGFSATMEKNLCITNWDLHKTRYLGRGGYWTYNLSLMFKTTILLHRYAKTITTGLGRLQNI